MINHFISAANTHKLEILRELINSDQTLHELAETLDISTNTVKRYINELNKELADFSVHHIQKNEDHRYRLAGDKQTAWETYSKSLYFYGLSSLTFQLCQLFISHKHLTLTKICEELHTSVSHAYRIIGKLNTCLSAFQIQITSNSEAVYYFKGKELNIRIFLFHFISQCIPSDVWLFPIVDRQEVQQKIAAVFDTSVMSTSTYHNLVCFLSIIKNRVSGKRFLPKINALHQGIFDYYAFLSYDQVSQLLPEQLDKKHLQKEYFYLNFFIRIFIPSVINETNFIELGKQIHESRNPLTTFFNGMLTDWKNQFAPQIPDNQYYYFVYNATLIYNLSILIYIDLLFTWDLNYFSATFIKNADHFLMEKINALVDRHVKECQTKDLDKDFFYQHQFSYLCNLLYIETKMLSSPVVTIHVSFFKDYHAIEFIKSKIYSIYNNKMIQFTHSPILADLVITDKYELATVAGEHLAINNFLEPSEWKMILSKINQQIVEKMDHAQ
ncbi:MULTISPECIES: helix-turn-helix domain-containing protein [unclassified Enterococcus]|jgi:predicted transcriptional regulator|uniref:helix-turn-helix domain-containing protein n=1 Tax=unclassified Enterococcus TaxID=2608891 RepID=UPI003D28F0B3